MCFKIVTSAVSNSVKYCKRFKLNSEDLMTGVAPELEMWAEDVEPKVLGEMLRAHGCTHAVVKILAPNDNSKNQIFLGNDFTDVAMIPSGSTSLNAGSSRKISLGSHILHASVNAYWLGLASAEPASHAQLILYPQYPEVRLSGLLKGVSSAPRRLLSVAERGRERGRIMILGINDVENAVFAVILSSSGRSSKFFVDLAREQGPVLLAQWLLIGPDFASKPRLLTELCRIARAGWISGKRLTRRGEELYRAQNGGGYTLEAELGISANGHSNPDFMGWEIKQHSVGRLDKPRASRVTLFTPEPDGGLYVTAGVREFIRKFGNWNLKKQRWDFTGSHRCDERSSKTGLKLSIDGFVSGSSRFEAGGKIALLDQSDLIVASWSFTKLLDHWKRKHAMAAYIPSMSRKIMIESFTHSEYQFGSRVELGEGTSFARLLEGISGKIIIYDPGIHLEQSGESKRRSQFRTSSKNLKFLYENFSEVFACGEKLS